MIWLVCMIAASCGNDLDDLGTPDLVAEVCLEVDDGDDLLNFVDEPARKSARKAPPNLPLTQKAQNLVLARKVKGAIQKKRCRKSRC